MSLADHWDEADGKYLGEGWHDATVVDFRLITFNSGNTGVSFKVEGADGRIAETEAFSLLPQSLWKLASFAKACGMTKEQCQQYNPDDANSHSVLLQRRVHVLIELEKEKYHRATQWEMAEQVAGSPSPASAPQPTTPGEEDTPF